MKSHKKADRRPQKPNQLPAKAAGEAQADAKATPPKLELVLKSDTTGSLEAVKTAILGALLEERIKTTFIQTGVGTINQSDLFMAEAGSQLIVGFNVDVDLKTEALLKTRKVEIRLYQIIYQLIEDIKALALSLLPRPAPLTETILGKARVIALFKSCRRGIIIGCEVEEGCVSIGQRFRVITAMGPAYNGKIESLQIEKEAVKQARPGQQVGIKIKNFNKVHAGDLVESYQPADSKSADKPWKPQSAILYR